MDKKIQKIVSFLEEKYGDGVAFSEDKLIEVVTNCVSLVKTFFDRFGGVNKKLSLEINLFDKAGALVDTLNGVTYDNVYETISGIVICNSHLYSKLSLDRFYFDEGEKVVENIGEIEIS